MKIFLSAHPLFTFSVHAKSNKIDDPAVLEVFKAMPDLRVLYLMGNPVVKKIRNYRKFLISELPNLRVSPLLPIHLENLSCVPALNLSLQQGNEPLQLLMYSCFYLLYSSYYSKC